MSAKGGKKRKRGGYLPLVLGLVVGVDSLVGYPLRLLVWEVRRWRMRSLGVAGPLRL